MMLRKARVGRVESGKPFAPSLKRNFSWTALGNVVYAVCQWGMLSVLAKLGNAEMVGQFALAVALTTPVFAFSNLQLRAVQATDAKHEYQFSDYLALRGSTTVAGLAIVLAIAFIGPYSHAVTSVLLVMGLGRALDAISDVFYGRFQQREQMDLIAKAMMVNGLVSVAALTVGVLATGQILVGVAGSTFASGLTLAMVVVLHRGSEEYGATTTVSSSVWRASGPRWSSEVVRQLFLLTLPMGVVMFLVSLNGNIPRYVVEAFGDERQVGIFSALSYLLVAGTTVVTALGQSASPRLARMYADGNIKGFIALLRKLLLLGFVLGIVGTLLSVIAGRRILSLLYTPEYAQYVDVLVVLASAAAFSFSASFMGYGMTAARKFRSQVPLFAGVTVMSLLSSLILVPAYGLVGAAWSVMVSGVLTLLGAGFVVQRAVAESHE